MTPQNLAESTTLTFSVIPGEVYTVALAGTWDGMTVTVKSNDGTTDVTLESFTADGNVGITAATPTLKVVSGADSTNAGALKLYVFQKLARWDDADEYPQGKQVIGV